MAKVLIIGAGVMGLAAAWQAVRDGHEVDLVEAAPVSAPVSSPATEPSIRVETTG